MPFAEEWLVGARGKCSSSTSFITRSATVAETGDPIVLIVFTCALCSHLRMLLYTYNWLSLQIEVMSCVQLNVSLL